jgi:mono/diheme cytochrome c family protein
MVGVGGLSNNSSDTLERKRERFAMNLAQRHPVPRRNRVPLTFLMLCCISGSQASDTGAAAVRFDVAKGKCARCHVIGEYNRMGGIGNAPSFPSMAQHEDVRERFSTFYARRPHPVFVRAPGYAQWSDAVSYYPEFKVSLAEINALVAYAESLRMPQA